MPTQDDFREQEQERIMSKPEPKPLPGPAPVCPICKETMVVAEYHGYYDGFSFWNCDCSDETLGEHATMEIKGGYA